MELEESICLTSGSTTKPQSSREYGTGTKTETYCLDDCSFVVEPEVRHVDSSSSILLSQDCFGYSRFFLYFHTNCEIICSSSVKNTVGSLIGIALNL